MKVSVITPSVRADMLEIVKNCLDKQTFKDFEWIVVGPENLISFNADDPQMPLRSRNKSYYFVKEPPKRDGDFYSLNKAWNEALKHANGELFVSIVDGLWFPPNTLELLWNHYLANPMACIGLCGNQYDETLQNLVWTDPRIKGQNFYEIPPYDLELCIASLPLKGIQDVGGIDEEFDKFPAWSEKDLACRMSAIGYRCFLDESIQYKAIHHPRLQGNKWEEKYPESCAYFQKCFKEIQEGKRARLDFLSDKEYKIIERLKA